MQRFAAVILGCAGDRLTPEERAVFAEAQPFGFILFARNISDPDQLRTLTADLRDAVGWHAPILLDQEGGRVQRLRAPMAREWLPPLDDVRRFGDAAERAMYLRYRLIADDMLRYGIDADCAPMLDVARPDTHAFLRNRCYGSDVDTVVRIGKAVRQGLIDGGVSPILKHMPGHGLSRQDSHLDLPRVTLERQTLEAIDFAAFHPFVDTPMAMTAHLVFEAFDERPATISPVMNAYIRETLGFDGLLMTDDISMQALSGTVAERGVAALAAGCDVVLHCNGDLDEMQALLAQTGPMTDAAQERAERALAARPEPQPVDIAGLEAEFEALTSERPDV